MKPFLTPAIAGIALCLSAYSGAADAPIKVALCRRIAPPARYTIRRALTAAAREQGKGEPLPAPLAQLLKDLQAADAKLASAQKRFKAAGIAEFSAVVACGGSVPAQIAAARRAMQLWKIEKLLRRYEKGRGR